MQFLRNLFGKPDPTRLWPLLTDQPMPMLDLSRPAFGSIVFKDNLQSAEFLGRPQKTVITARCMDLTYPRYIISFEDNMFTDVHVYFKSHTDEVICQELFLTNGMVVTPGSNMDELTARLGKNFDGESWEKYGVLQYSFGNLILEFVFDEEKMELDYLHAYLDFV